MTDTQSPAVTADGLLKDVKTFFDHGEFFRAYIERGARDLAMSR